MFLIICASTIAASNAEIMTTGCPLKTTKCDLKINNPVTSWDKSWTPVNEKGDISGNHELQDYDPAQVLGYATNKALALQLKRATKDDTHKNGFVSGKIILNSTITSYAKTHGYYEVSFKAPHDINKEESDLATNYKSVRGLWPAIWMLPLQTTSRVWANGGELDLFELFEQTTSVTPPKEFNSALHFGPNIKKFALSDGRKIMILPNGEKVLAIPNANVGAKLSEEGLDAWYLESEKKYWGYPVKTNMQLNRTQDGTDLTSQTIGFEWQKITPTNGVLPYWKVAMYFNGTKAWEKNMTRKPDIPNSFHNFENTPAKKFYASANALNLLDAKLKIPGTVFAEGSDGDPAMIFNRGFDSIDPSDAYRVIINLAFGGDPIPNADVNSIRSAVFTINSFKLWDLAPATATP